MLVHVIKSDEVFQENLWLLEDELHFEATHTLQFESFNTLTSIRDTLYNLERESLHILCDGGYVYRSLELARWLDRVCQGGHRWHLAWLPPVGGLKERVYEILESNVGVFENTHPTTTVRRNCKWIK